MPMVRILFISSLLIILAAPADPRSVQQPSKKTAHKLSKTLVGRDGRVYACSARNFFVFESNGTIAWTVHLEYICTARIAPVHGGRGKIYLVAENRVLKLEISHAGDSESAPEVFYTNERASDIIGLSVSTSLSSIFITIENTGLFAFSLHGKLLWSAGPLLYQFGYPQGCKKNVTDCYFSSVPVIDHCEASLYIANNKGELYSLSVHHPRFRWIQDFSSFDRIFTITAGNNGRLYVTIPVRSLVFALDVLTGNVLWQTSIGPLCPSECAPVVDCNGWISVGSLDGFLYSLSPTGHLKKSPRAARLNSVIQVSPLIDCSGYAIYVAHTEMDGKISHTIGEDTYVSALQPRSVALTLLVPATGSVYWYESSHGGFSPLLYQSDLRHFVLDEGVLLSFIAASKIGNPLPCRTTREKISSTCSQAETDLLSIYTGLPLINFPGNERAILLLLIFETAVLIVLVGLVRFCCIFWKKKKLQGQNLGNFLEKRRSLQLKQKDFSRTITQLEQKAADETASNEMLEELSNLVREREGVERKLSTTYSLGRDRDGSRLKSLLPVYDESPKSYSFRGSKKESVTLFHTLSNTSSSSSSGDYSSGRESSGSCWESDYDDERPSSIKAKTDEKQAVQVASSGDDDDDDGDGKNLASSSRGFADPLSGGKIWLKRRTFSSG